MINNQFINYAHRGASEYLPENTLLSFYCGLYMDANGIETDVQKTKDGTLILFHDSTIDRVTDGTGNVSDYTFEELKKFNVLKNGFADKIISLEEFLERFYFRDITFAIELKGADVEKETADLLRKYNMQSKTVVTSFKIDYLKNFRNYAPEFQIGLLAQKVDDEILTELKAINAEELCPEAKIITKDLVDGWHKSGFRVRAWGVVNEELMHHAYECDADGMTVNFPDKLTELLNSK